MRLALAVSIVSLALSGCFKTIDTGHRGLKTIFGKVVGEPVGEGLYWYFPFIPVGSNYVDMNVQEQVWAAKADSFTADQQRAIVSFTLNYYPDAAHVDELYKHFGADWAQKNLEQFTLQAIKDVIGHTNANDLVQRREESTEKSFQLVKGEMAARHIIVTSLKWTNVDFDDAYEKAVEAKVVQIQRAQEAQNHTVQITEEAKQKVIAAEAEAKAMSIKSEALAKNQRLIQYEAVLRWDGHLPKYMMGSSTPFVSLKEDKE